MGGEAFALNVRRVAEILAAQNARPIPAAPDFLTGVIDLRGQAVPLVDLRKRFGIRPAPGSRDRVIVLRKRNERIGVAVDDVREVVQFDSDTLEPAPSLFRGIGGEYLHGIGRVGGRMVVVVDIRRVLNENDLMLMQQAVINHGQRG